MLSPKPLIRAVVAVYREKLVIQKEMRVRWKGSAS